MEQKSDSGSFTAAGLKAAATSSPAGRPSPHSEPLLELARKKFGALTDGEQRFFRAVVDGRFPDYSSPTAAENDPADAANWSAKRVLSAEKIAWLATDLEASRFVTHRGIGIKGARIEGRLDLQAANIVFALYFDRCVLASGLNLLGAEIHALNLSGSHVGRITADGMKVEGGVFLRAGFKSTGHVRLLGAHIGGNLDCEAGHFANPGGEALAIDGAQIAGSVLLNRRFVADGQVRLLGAEIGGNLSCDAGVFINVGKEALLADRLKVDGNVFLSDGFQPRGRVALPSAIIHGFVVWQNVAGPENTTLDLRSAKIGTLWIGRESWPAQGHLLLHGLTYDELDDRSSLDARLWIEWLRLQPPIPFRPQPYEQLAAVLRKDGQDSDSKKVLFAKEHDRAHRAPLSWSQVPWYRLFGPLIGYGYKPWRAFWVSLAVIICGCVLFGIGAHFGLMTPAKAEAFVADGKGGAVVSNHYPAFSAFVYSLDTFTPLIDLGQADYWLPNATNGSDVALGVTTGALLRTYMWFHIIAGWILSTLLFVGLSGTVPGA
ncbi:MAG TPA: hypothetical protein VHZ24_02365 [Pirellulales bacterium]|jgi:hypothetical protein|nr:hypothetical protein [Pirellulales bacterium]